MITPDREHAVSAQEVEIFVALAVEQILSGAAAEPNIISNRVEDANHLLVEMARMHLKALGLVLRIALRDVRALQGAIAAGAQAGPMTQCSSSSLRVSAARAVTPGRRGLPGVG